MSDFVSCLDVGPAAEHTALAVLEKDDRPGGAAYDLRHLERFPPGTRYAVVVAALGRLWAAPPLRGSALAVDLTGVGRPVLDLIRAAGLDAGVYPVTVTAGRKAACDDDGTHAVPRAELASGLQVLLQSGRLRIAQGLKHAGTLEKELTTFRAKVTLAANEAVGPWREGPHDDLVLAVAVAAWVGENCWVGAWEVTADPAARSEMSRAPRGVFLCDDREEDGPDDGGYTLFRAPPPPWPPGR